MIRGARQRTYKENMKNIQRKQEVHYLVKKKKKDMDEEEHLMTFCQTYSTFIHKLALNVASEMNKCLFSIQAIFLLNKIVNAQV